MNQPITGLHFDDAKKLLAVLHKLVSAGNTLVVVEHNMDVIKCADWIIDLGPEGGAAGGENLGISHRTVPFQAFSGTSFIEFEGRAASCRFRRKTIILSVHAMYIWRHHECRTETQASRTGPAQD